MDTGGRRSTRSRNFPPLFHVEHDRPLVRPYKEALMRLTRYLVLPIVLAACLGVAAAGPIQKQGKDELTFSASLFNPNEGDTVWTATGEYLIGVSPHLLIGPSLSMFDTGPTDGTAFGLAGELGF